MGRLWFRNIRNILDIARQHGTRNCCDTACCKLLIVGGGSGGCSTAWRFSKKLKPQDIIVLEPAERHYYQPLFTLVAAGMKKFSHSHRPMASVLPARVHWIKACAAEFDPRNCQVHTCCGKQINYEYMVVAVGLVNDYEMIPGLKRALDDPNSGVSTIYDPEYCLKTWSNLQHFRGGHAVYTFPRIGGKCPGAALKIMYLGDHYWRQHKMRHLVNISYNTAGVEIFGIPKYARTLRAALGRRCIADNCCLELVEVAHTGAVFRTSDGHMVTVPYNLLHVTPPMSPPLCLKRSELASSEGYLTVDPHTLQHCQYENVYGVGDCLDTKNSKTAAAVAHQSYVVESNLSDTMRGKEASAHYGGYGACPMLTSYNTGILAEFLYDKKPCETFPFDQSVERRFFSHLNKTVLPYIYWNQLIKGTWNGPSKIRRIINPFGK